MDLQVVIVNWNSGEHLGHLLSGLDAVRPEVRQVLVADNASVDGSVVAAKTRPAVDVMSLDRNSGFAAAANRAIEQCDSAWILLLNPDIVVSGATVNQLYERAQAMPDVGIACVMLRDHLGRSQAAFQLRRLPTVWRLFSDVLFLDELTRSFRASETEPASPVGGTAAQPVTIEQPAAAFWLIRRSVWNDLGGFDERFWPAWFEDVDFCRRLSGTGWRAVVFPDLQARHSGGHSLAVMPYDRFLDCYYGNMLRYVKKHHTAAYPLLWPAAKVGVLLRKLFVRGRARSDSQQRNRVDYP